MKFNIDDYPIGSNTVMHCSTEDEARRFLYFLDSCGVKWSNGDCLTTKTMYDRNRSETCYNFTRGLSFPSDTRTVKIETVQYYRGDGFTILESTDFDFGSEEDDLCTCEDIDDFLSSLIAK